MAHQLMEPITSENVQEKLGDISGSWEAFLRNNPNFQTIETRTFTHFIQYVTCVKSGFRETKDSFKSWYTWCCKVRGFVNSANESLSEFPEGIEEKFNLLESFVDTVDGSIHSLINLNNELALKLRQETFKKEHHKNTLKDQIMENARLKEKIVKLMNEVEEMKHKTENVDSLCQDVSRKGLEFVEQKNQSEMDKKSREYENKISTLKQEACDTEFSFKLILDEITNKHKEDEQKLKKKVNALQEKTRTGGNNDFSTDYIEKIFKAKIGEFERTMIEEIYRSRFFGADVVVDNYRPHPLHSHQILRAESVVDSAKSD